MGYIYSITNNINKFRFIGITTKSNPYDEWKKYNQIKIIKHINIIDQFYFNYFINILNRIN